MKFSNFSPENASAILFQSSINELKAGISSLPQQQLTSCISLLQAQGHTDAEERLVAMTLATDEAIRLEAIGKGLSLHQFFILLDAISQHILPVEKLSPLLVGMAPAIFQQALNQLTASQLNTLKQESLAEPLQHQLALFSHAYEKFYQEQEAAVSQIYKNIADCQCEELSYKLLAEIKERINEIRNFAEGRLQAIDQALSITWATNRLDLVKNLNQLKEHFYHQLHQQIGSPTTSENNATGLYAALQQFLFGAFNKSNRNLEDNEAAIEGLAQFSIWYLPDYWEVGLLPHILSSERLELDPAQHSEEERFIHRQSLFSQVQQNLAKLDLNSIHDLKRFQIFSKNMLKEYIVAHQKLIS